MNCDPINDPFNSTAVKVAEATRIRLYLPGLTGFDEAEDLLKGTASLVKPGAAATGSDISRKTARKLQKAAKYAAQLQGVQGDQTALQQVFLEPEAESEDSSDTEQVPVTTGIVVAGVGRNESGSGAAREKNEFAPKGSSPGGPNLIHGLKGALKHSPMKSRTASSAGAQIPEVPRVPIWERPTAPPGGIAVREVLAAAAAAPKVFKAVVAKTFSLGADTGRPLSFECTEGDARFATSRKTFSITVNCAPSARPASTPHSGPAAPAGTGKQGNALDQQQPAEMPVSPGRRASRPAEPTQRVARTPPASNPLLNLTAPSSRPPVARASSQQSLGGAVSQDAGDLALVPTGRADSCSSLMGRPKGSALLLVQDTPCAHRLGSTSPSRRVPLLNRLYQANK